MWPSLRCKWSASAAMRLGRVHLEGNEPTHAMALASWQKLIGEGAIACRDYGVRDTIA